MAVPWAPALRWRIDAKTHGQVEHLAARLMEADPSLDSTTALEDAVVALTTECVGCGCRMAHGDPSWRDCEACGDAACPACVRAVRLNGRCLERVAEGEAEVILCRRCWVLAKALPKLADRVVDIANRKGGSR